MTTPATEMIEHDCPTGCGRRVRLQVPTGDTPHARYIRALSRSVNCAECTEEAQRLEAAIEARKAMEARVSKSWLPRELHGLRWADLDPDEEGRNAAISTIKRWSSEDGFEPSILTLAGPVGTGKTRLAATAMWAKMRRGSSMRWLSVARLVTMDRAGFGSTEKHDATQVLMGRQGLVLDDLDKVNPTESVRSLIFQAIDGRDQAGIPMLLTTNLTSKKLGDVMGEAIHSRLTRPGAFLMMNGRDRRGDS